MASTDQSIPMVTAVAVSAFVAAHVAGLQPEHWVQPALDAMFGQSAVSSHAPAAVRDSVAATSVPAKHVVSAPGVSVSEIILGWLASIAATFALAGIGAAASRWKFGIRGAYRRQRHAQTQGPAKLPGRGAVGEHHFAVLHGRQPGRPLRTRSSRARYALCSALLSGACWTVVQAGPGDLSLVASIALLGVGFALTYAASTVASFVARSLLDEAVHAQWRDEATADLARAFERFRVDVQPAARNRVTVSLVRYRMDHRDGETFDQRVKAKTLYSESVSVRDVAATDELIGRARDEACQRELDAELAWQRRHLDAPVALGRELRAVDVAADARRQLDGGWPASTYRSL
jgi:hypothetical protein